MKLNSYLVNNIRLKKGRTIFCVLGLCISMICALEIQLVMDHYMGIVNGTFSPFDGYDQVIEKGSNYMQLLPVSSAIDISINQTLQEYFQEEPIPCLFEPYGRSNLAFYNRYLIGMPLEHIPEIWNKVGLYKGCWPENRDEVIVGSHWNLNQQFNYLNYSFKAVGILYQNYSFIDRTIIGNINLIQNLTRKHNQVNMFLIPHSIEHFPEKIKNFESNHPTLDVLTQSDFNQLISNIKSEVTQISRILIFISNSTAMLFVFTLEILEMKNQQKVFNLLAQLGASNTIIKRIPVIQHILYIIMAIIVSIPLSMIIFGIIYAFVRISVNSSACFIKSIRYGLNHLFYQFPFHIYSHYLLFFTLTNLAISFILTTLMIPLKTKPKQRKYNFVKY